jgi:predicted nucleic acid-binding protein
MAPEPLFIDSGGFYALVSAESTAHADAVAITNRQMEDRMSKSLPHCELGMQSVAGLS